MKWNVVNYDVWGNAKDGFEVNGAFYFEHNVEISDDADKKDIIKAMKQIGFFHKFVRSNMVDISWYDSMIEFTQRKDGMPLGRIEHAK